MKPKTLGYLVLPALLAAGTAHAQTIKADNATDLGQAGSWVGGVLPPTTGVAQINNTLAGFSALTVGTNLQVRTLSFVDPASDVGITVSNTRTLTVGDSAAANGTNLIDMTSATRDLTISRAGNGVLRVIAFNNVNTIGNFNVASGRTLTINSPITTTNSRKSIGITGAGNVVINGAVTGTGGFLGLSVQAGTLELNGVNKWIASGTGEKFEITGGTLKLGNDSALVNDGVTVANPFKFNGGTVQASGGDRVITTTGIGFIHGYRIGGNLTVSGDNSLTLAGGKVTNVTNANNTLTNSITAVGKSLTLASNVELSNDATGRTLTIDGAGSTLVSGLISNGSTSTSGLTKSGLGTLTLSNIGNSFTGPLTINAGSVLLGASGVIADATPLVLGGGTFDLGGFSETLGTLTVGGNSVLDLGTTGTVSFASSESQAWSGSLSISGTFNTSSVRFGTSFGALTVGQLGAITVNGFGGFGLDADGFLTAVPEPATWATLTGLVALGFVSCRRRKL